MPQALSTACTAVLPQMRERSDGLVINISSIAGKRAAAGRRGLLRFEVRDDGPRHSRRSRRAERHSRHNIYPGEVDTPILETDRPVCRDRARILQPEDVAAAVVMIAKLPPRAHVAELVIKPTTQDYA